QHAFHLEPEVVVKAARRVLLNYERAAGRGTALGTFASERFRSARRASFASVLSQRHGSLRGGTSIHTISGGLGMAPLPSVVSFRQKLFLLQAAFVVTRFRTHPASIGH